MYTGVGVFKGATGAGCWFLSDSGANAKENALCSPSEHTATQLWASFRFRCKCQSKRALILFVERASFSFDESISLFHMFQRRTAGGGQILTFEIHLRLRRSLFSWRCNRVQWRKSLEERKKDWKSSVGDFKEFPFAWEVTWFYGKKIYDLNTSIHPKLNKLLNVTPPHQTDLSAHVEICNVLYLKQTHSRSIFYLLFRSHVSFHSFSLPINPPLSSWLFLCTLTLFWGERTRSGVTRRGQHTRVKILLQVFSHE